MSIDSIIKLSLVNIQEFLNCIGNPQNKIPNIINIAGTNGKGSTLSFIRSILEHHGYRVNTFTSPHLVDYKERFYLAGKHATIEQITKITDYFKTIPEYSKLTPFEAITAVGFQLFFQYPADYLILETGLGGRLDATNIIQSAICSVITKIGFDHQKFLGNTLAKIAYEKAGIIKQNIQVISDYQVPEVLEVLQKVSQQRSAQLMIGGQDYQLSQAQMKFKNKNFDLRNLSLLGEHQQYNASLAIACVLSLPQIKLQVATIIQAVNHTQWSGRIQSINNLYDINNNNTQIFLDGAHNQLGAEVLTKFIKAYIKKEHINSVHIIFGMLKTKNLDDFLNYYTDIKLTLYPIMINHNQAYSQDEIALVSQKHHINTIIYKNVKEAITTINQHKEKKLLVICGSLYLLGQILKENNYKISL